MLRSKPNILSSRVGMASSRTFRSESFNISDETQNDWWQEQILCILKTHGFPRTRSIYPKKNGVSKKNFDGSLVLSSKEAKKFNHVKGTNKKMEHQ
ncbi:hypothetical protein HanPI659440_Chr04g0156801 [Helianthus annuus]|nr:hypothetical protein HanPI659440_Chr04g0156801 [Helianthus annuus]